MNKPQFQELLRKHQDGSITPEEKALLNSWYNHFTSHSSNVISEDDLEASVLELQQRLKLDKKPTIQRLWPRITIAAAVATIIFGAGLFIYKSKQTDQVQTAVYANDVAPGKQGATLTLANGKKIRLSDARNGDLASQAGVVIKKLDNGQLVYELTVSDKVSADLGAINTLSTSNGETYILTLPDKSKVWLNSASSLTYSANLLKEGKRSVKLQGEAYFEIAKDKKHPFVVETDKQNVEVLGTHFNINSYADEQAVATTLLEGSVKVSSAGASKILKPGEQAINSDKQIKVVEANMDQVIDWKDGDFNLNGLDFKVAMRKISRWYDVEMIYNASVPDGVKTGGWISRDSKLSDILKLIEKTGLVHFEIKGKQVYVSK